MGNFHRRKKFTNKWKRFLWRKLSRIACWCRQNMPHPQILQRDNSQIAIKPQNSQKFSPSKVSCFTLDIITICNHVSFLLRMVMIQWPQQMCLLKEVEIISHILCTQPSHHFGWLHAIHHSFQVPHNLSWVIVWYGCRVPSPDTVATIDQYHR